MRAWAVRWRVALRIARREAWRHKGRTVMVVLLIMLPVVATTVIVGTSRSSVPTLATRAAWSMGDRAQARLEVGCNTFGEPTKQQVGVSLDCGQSDVELHDGDVERITAKIPAGDDLLTASKGRFDLRGDSALVPDSLTLQVDTAQAPGLFSKVRGDASPNSGQVVLNSSTASQLQAAVGSTISLDVGEGLVPVTVVGIGEGNPDLKVLVGPDSLPDRAGQPIWFVTGDEPVTWTQVEELNTLGLWVNSRDVMLDPPSPQEVYGGAFAQDGLNAPMLGMVGGVLAVGLIEVFLLIGPAFAVGAKRTARQLALVAASGGRPADLRRIVLASGLVAGLVAGVLGALLGTGIALGLYAFMAMHGTGVPNVVIPVPETVAAVLVAALLGLAAAWLPARHAAKENVVLVLAGRRAEPASKRSTAWIGIAVSGIGVIGALLAAATESVVGLVASLIAIEVGLVLAAGVAVSLAIRFAPRLRVAGRFALRDAARNRSRTVPAVAAVLAAVAAATAGMVMLSSSDRASEARETPLAADGVGFFALIPFDTAPTDVGEVYDKIADSIETDLSGMSVLPIRHLQPPRKGGDEAPYLNALINPARVCPAGSQQGPEAKDERCRVTEDFSREYLGAGNLVDDGSVVNAFGLPGAREASQALASGHVLVNDPALVWPDGGVHLTFGNSESDQLIKPISVPAQVVDWKHSEYQLVFPPQVAKQLRSAVEPLAAATHQEGEALTLNTIGGVLEGGPLSPPDAAHVRSILTSVDVPFSLYVAGADSARDSSPVLLVILSAAVLVALFATALSVGLAIVDSRADLEILAAVGASPKMRRRVRSAQAGVIAVIGTLAGVVAGLLLAVVLGRWQVSYLYSADIWKLVIPWQYILTLALGLPLLAILGGWLLTRSRLPMPRRAAS